MITSIGEKFKVSIIHPKLIQFINKLPLQYDFFIERKTLNNHTSQSKSGSDLIKVDFTTEFTVRSGAYECSIS